jgi:serine/arginine repetitive matrix protein 2
MDALRAAFGLQQAPTEGDAFDRELQERKRQERLDERERAVKERERAKRVRASAARVGYCPAVAHARCAARTGC